MFFDMAVCLKDTFRRIVQKQVRKPKYLLRHCQKLFLLSHHK